MLERISTLQNKAKQQVRGFRHLRTFAIALCLVLCLFAIPTLAQPLQSSPGADVLVDGQVAFRVNQFGQFTAEERADWINSQLQTAIESIDPVSIAIEKRNEQLIIVANGRYLLTVTEQDLKTGSTPQEQAEIWSTQLQQLVQKSQEQRGADYLWKASILVAIAILTAILLHWLLGRLWPRFFRKAMHRFWPREEALSSGRGRILNLSRKLTLLLLRVGVWLLAAIYIVNLFPLSRQWSYRLISDLTVAFTSPLFTLGDRSYSVIDVLILIGLFWGLTVVASAVMELVRSHLLDRLGIGRGTQEVVAIVAKYSLIVIGTIVLLQVWGLDLSSLTILGGALGVGIGFGFQDIAKNFGSGLVLLFERSIQAGDFIEVGDRMGSVEHIGARSIVLRTLDRISVIVPNSRLLENEVINWSHNNPVSRLHLPVGVAYGSALGTVKSALLQAAREHSEVLNYPSPDVIFVGFGESSLDFELLVWIAKPSRQLMVTSDLYFRIDDLLRQQQIEIPFPQHDLHLRSENLPVALSPNLETALLKFLNGSTDDTTIPSQSSEEEAFPEEIHSEEIH